MKVIKFKAGNEPEVVELPEKHSYLDIKAICEIEDSPLDCVERSIGGKLYDIWCDDEGLLHGDDKFVVGMYRNVMNPYGVEFLVGAIMIAKHDGEGGIAGLSENDIKNIIRHKVPSSFLKGAMGEIDTTFGVLKFKEEGSVIVYA